MLPSNVKELPPSSHRLYIITYIILTLIKHSFYQLKINKSIHKYCLIIVAHTKHPLEMNFLRNLVTINRAPVSTREGTITMCLGLLRRSQLLPSIPFTEEITAFNKIKSKKQTNRKKKKINICLSSFPKNIIFNILFFHIRRIKINDTERVNYLNTYYEYLQSIIMEAVT